ncbi:MAG: hypothetical protein ACHQM6_07080, partial [Candidatus Kapaibacterium sp.]
MNPSKLSLLALIITCAAMISHPLFAQTNPEDSLPYKAYEIGIFGTGGVCIFNGTVPDGSKTDIHSAFTFGALAAIAANRDIGFALGIGYEARGMFFKQQNVTTPNETIGLNYLSIQPSIRFKSFLLGINIGLPMSSSFDTSGDVSPSNAGFFTKDHMGTVIDIRATGLLPIVENDIGNLYFIIQLSYPVSNAMKDGFFTVNQTNHTTSDLITKSPIPTVQAGLSYLFSPGAKTK